MKAKVLSPIFGGSLRRTFPEWKIKKCQKWRMNARAFKEKALKKISRKERQIFLPKVTSGKVGTQNCRRRQHRKRKKTGPARFGQSKITRIRAPNSLWSGTCLKEKRREIPRKSRKTFGAGEQEGIGLQGTQGTLKRLGRIELGFFVGRPALLWRVQREGLESSLFKERRKMGVAPLTLEY